MIQFDKLDFNELIEEHIEFKSNRVKLFPRVLSF